MDLQKPHRFPTAVRDYLVLGSHLKEIKELKSGQYVLTFNYGGLDVPQKLHIEWVEDPDSLKGLTSFDLGIPVSSRPKSKEEFLNRVRAALEEVDIELPEEEIREEVSQGIPFGITVPYVLSNEIPEAPTRR